MLWELTESLGERITVAPEAPHSYQAHRVTVERSLHLRQRGPGQYSVDGTPVDCVRIALCSLMPDVDWVISGINAGASLGADVYTSATVAAAREAALLGYRAIAVSHYISRGREVDWNLAMRRAFPVIRTLLHSPLESQSFWNVNLPHVDSAAPVEVAFRPIDPTPLDVQYVRHENSFTFIGQFHTRPLMVGHDVESCLNGRITLSRISLAFGMTHPGQESFHGGGEGGGGHGGGGHHGF